MRRVFVTFFYAAQQAAGTGTEELRSPHEWTAFGASDGTLWADQKMCHPAGAFQEQTTYPHIQLTTTEQECRNLYYKVSDTGWAPLAIGFDSGSCFVFLDNDVMMGVIAGNFTSSSSVTPTTCSFASCAWQPNGMTELWRDTPNAVLVAGTVTGSTGAVDSALSTSKCQVCTGLGCTKLSLGVTVPNWASEASTADSTPKTSVVLNVTMDLALPVGKTMDDAGFAFEMDQSWQDFLRLTIAGQANGLAGIGTPLKASQVFVGMVTPKTERYPDGYYRRTLSSGASASLKVGLLYLSSADAALCQSQASAWWGAVVTAMGGHTSTFKTDYAATLQSALASAAEIDGNFAETLYWTGGRPDWRAVGGSSARDAVVNGTVYEAPQGLVGVPYLEGMYTGDTAYTKATYKIPTNPYGTGLGGAGDAPYDKNASSGRACTAQGFVCDFSQVQEMTSKEVSPMDFVWKVVDPRTWDQDPYNWTTLNCEVYITAPGQNLAQEGHFFYVPLGGQNTGGGDYCDIESTLRQIDQQNLTMSDRIKIRGETARLNNAQQTEFDLIGHQFDVSCGCTTSLVAEASVTLSQPAVDLLQIMTSTGQERSLKIELRLYKDEYLAQEYQAGSEYFPAGRPYFFFLVRHLFDNDWDAVLQINKCIACRTTVPKAKCNTKTATSEAVLWLDQCDTLYGGPKRIPIHADSWYRDSSVSTSFKGKTGRWASENPNFCPYDAIGIQKFRLSGTDAMKIVCAVTGCVERPCPPCTRYYGENGGTPSASTGGARVPGTDGNDLGDGSGSVRPGAGDQFDPSVNMRRRRLERLRGSRRRVQESSSSVDLALTIGFDAATGEEIGPSENNAANNTNEKEKKKSRVSIMLLIILALFLGISAYFVVTFLRKRKATNEAKGIAPGDQCEKLDAGPELGEPEF